MGGSLRKTLACGQPCALGMESDGIVGTYCNKPAGHGGEHGLELRIEIQPASWDTIREAAKAVRAAGTPCGCDMQRNSPPCGSCVAKAKAALEAARG